MLCAHCRWGMEALHICTASWPYRVGDELLDNLSLDTAQSCINKVLGLHRYIRVPKPSYFPLCSFRQRSNMLLVHADERGERQAVRKARFQNSVPAALFSPSVSPLCAMWRLLTKRQEGEIKKNQQSTLFWRCLLRVRKAAVTPRVVQRLIWRLEKKQSLSKRVQTLQ